MEFIDRLKSLELPDDIKELNDKQLKTLSKDIRKFLITSVSKTGGHLASNLGVVELTLALFKSFNFSKDSIVWDVGHQSYVYKLLTGRMNGFSNLREYGQMSGFPSISESKYDSFGTGHASTSIAAANGIANAKKLRGDNSYTIAVIGDGALTGGLALEGINNIACSNNRLIIILNDNEMSIDENIGATNNALSKIRISKRYNNIKYNISYSVDKIPKVGKYIHQGITKTKNAIKQMIIPEMKLENLGIKYYGPINGHNITSLVGMFEQAKGFNRPIVIHIKTQKGRGYSMAVKEPSKYHGVNPFNPDTGKIICKKTFTYTDIFEDALYNLAKEKKDLVAISAAMISSTGLLKMKTNFPDRTFDVGIAEQYAVTFAAGFASKGIKPVVAIYSTFLQRAYDQILHDVCIQNLPVIFAIDRAGIVGKDGVTHQGLFDISFLNTLPNMNIIAPINKRELEESLKFAYELNLPIAIRYPRGEVIEGLEDKYEDYKYGKGQIIKEGKDIAIVAAGTMIFTALEVAKKLEKECISVSVINPRFLKPFDTDLLDEICEKIRMVITIEEGIISGGFGRNVADYIRKKYGIRVKNIGIDNKFVPHGDVNVLKKEFGLDADTIYDEIIKEYRLEGKTRRISLKK